MLDFFGALDIIPDPYESLRVPGVNCSLSVYSLNNPAHGVVKHLTNQMVWMTLSYLLGWYATDQRSASTITAINIHHTEGPIDPVGAVVIKPFEG